MKRFRITYKVKGKDSSLTFYVYANSEQGAIACNKFKQSNYILDSIKEIYLTI